MTKYTLTKTENNLDAISESNKERFNAKIFSEKNYAWFKSHPVELLRLTAQKDKVDFWHNALNKPKNIAYITNRLCTTALITSGVVLGGLVLFGLFKQISTAYMFSAFLIVYFGLRAFQNLANICFLNRYKELYTFLRKQLSVDVFDARLRFEKPNIVIEKEALKKSVNRSYFDHAEPFDIFAIRTNLNDKYTIDRLTEEYLYSIERSMGSISNNSISDYAEYKLKTIDANYTCDQVESLAFKTITEDFKKKQIANLNDDEDLAVTFCMPDIHESIVGDHKFIVGRSVVGVSVGLFILLSAFLQGYMSEAVSQLLTVIITVHVLVLFASVIVLREPSTTAVDFKKEKKKIKASVRNFNDSWRD